jgi:hypothetical protein
VTYWFLIPQIKGAVPQSEHLSLPTVDQRVATQHFLFAYSQLSCCCYDIEVSLCNSSFLIIILSSCSCLFKKPFLLLVITVQLSFNSAKQQDDTAFLIPPFGIHWLIVAEESIVNSYLIAYYDI